VKTYPTELKAYMRVKILRRRYGVWPGIILCDDGSYRLTFDPQLWELS
jgi:hypothetical protein